MEKINKEIKVWSRNHFLNLFVFNLIIMLLVMLHQAGYFQPFYFLSINAIVLIAILLSIPMFGAKSRHIIIISLVFLVITFFTKFIRVDFWAERASIYFFQSFVIGILLLIKENIK